MVEFRPTQQGEYIPVFQLMRENMESLLREQGVSWDQAWVEENYASKVNHSIFVTDRWIGFISLEWVGSTVFIHTLQLTKSAQGSVYGYRIYEWLLQQADVRGVTTVCCRTFRHSPLVDLYQKLGFSVVSTEGILVTLEKHV